MPCEDVRNTERNTPEDFSPGIFFFLIFFLINYKYFFHLSTFIKELFKLLSHLHFSRITYSQSRSPFHILNPRALMHSLWASIRCPQCSSPFSRMHASRAFLVSGQAQQGFRGFFSCVSDGRGLAATTPGIFQAQSSN